jgi:hypothetical protein
MSRMSRRPGCTVGEAVVSVIWRVTEAVSWMLEPVEGREM